MFVCVKKREKKTLSEKVLTAIHCPLSCLSMFIQLQRPARLSFGVQLKFTILQMAGLTNIVKDGLCGYI